MKMVLTIAGFDPSSGAGVTADLMVFAAHGLFGASCITALTVQSTLGVQSIYPTSDRVIGATLRCLNEDMQPGGIKIGMIANSNNAIAISEYLMILNVLRRQSIGQSDIPIVLDPVLRSSSGRELLDLNGVRVMRERLLPIVDWLTPNVDELAILSDKEVSNHEDIENACYHLQANLDRKDEQQGPIGIVATGGHLDRPDDFLLLPTGEGFWLSGERVETQSTHGTGCAFSSAFLSRLVLGDPPMQAAQGAKGYVAGALQAAQAIGKGHGPINHLWNLSERSHEVFRSSASEQFRRVGEANDGLQRSVARNLLP